MVVILLFWIASSLEDRLAKRLPGDSHYIVPFWVVYDNL